MEDVLKTVESAPETTKAQKTNKKPSASRVRPLSLKVPVAVQGTLPSANSEEFCEETNTIIVFQYGAVVRLSACVNVGQLVVLTNRNTNQEVLCSVIKIKADPDTKDYVELQFSQPQHGFWQQDGQQPSPLAETRRDPEEPRRETPGSRATAAASAEAPTGIGVAENHWHDRFTQVSATPFDFAEAGLNPSSATSSSATSVAVLENPSAATQAAQLNSPEIRGAGFWEASFPQEILAATETATSEYREASAVQPQRESPTNGNRPHRAAPRPEVIPFRSQDEHVLVRGDLLAKAKIGIAALGLAAIAGVVGVAMHAHRPATAPLSTADPAPASDIATPTRPEVDVPASSAPVAREKLRQSDAEDTEPQPEENTRSNTDRNSVSTKALPLSSTNSRPILGTAVAKPVNESPVTGAPPVAALREALPLDLNPKSDDPAPGPRSLSMPAPAAVSAPMVVGGKFQQARLISSVPPNYPNNARNLRIEGSVVVHGTIDVNGQVTNMSVVSGAAVLRPAALEAIRKWKYAPGLLDGKPAPTDIDITVEFRIH